MPTASQNQPSALPEISSADEAQLRDALKRCSPATVEAALRYRQTKDAALLSVIVLGIIERFLEPAAVARLREADDDVRMVEDLGLDSLTLIEAIMKIEEVLDISIKNEDLRNLRTIGDVRGFIEHRALGLPPPAPSKFLPVEAIAAVMPQQPPFLFLREATISTNWASGLYVISGDESFLAGHFKDNPIFPASILLEALGQLAVLYLLQAQNPQLTAPVDPKTILFTGCDGVRCHRVCRPGDTLKLSVKPRRLRMPLASFEGAVRVGQERAAVAEEISLTFGFQVETPTAAGAEKVDTAPAAESPAQE